jgi:hypothetical protein
MAMSSRDLSQQLWKAYERVVPTGSIVPLAFIVRTRTARDAELLKSRFTAQRCAFVWLKKKWWPSARPWELVLKSAPMTYSPEALEAWSDAVDRELAPVGAELTHWVPAQADA